MLCAPQSICFIGYVLLTVREKIQFCYDIHYISNVTYQSRLVSHETRFTFLDMRFSSRETRLLSCETRIASHERVV